MREVNCGNCSKMRVTKIGYSFRFMCHKGEQFKPRHLPTRQDFNTPYWEKKARECVRFDSMGEYDFYETAV